MDAKGSRYIFQAMHHVGSGSARGGAGKFEKSGVRAKPPTQSHTQRNKFLRAMADDDPTDLISFFTPEELWEDLIADWPRMQRIVDTSGSIARLSSINTKLVALISTAG